MEKEIDQVKEEQKRDILEELRPNEPTICDVKACCQNISISEILEKVLNKILRPNITEIQITELKSALLKIKIQDEGIQL